MSDLISRDAAIAAIGVIGNLDDRAWAEKALRALPVVQIHTTADAPAVKVKALPRLTGAMVEAACVGHYGRKAVAQLGGAGGVDMTADGINYTFPDAFRRMWRGIAKHLAALEGGE